ncbi:MAG: TIGR04438 family Trp-rich protein [Undibacterium sp.]|nr:TIGR04438 family Trp-rich protein [Undibacterium sp.]
MFFIILIALLCILKYFEVSFMSDISWWWISGLALLVFIWFEFIERMLGLDKRPDDMHHKKMHTARMKRNKEENKKR